MDYKSSSSGNKNSLDSEKSLFERIEQELKNVLFGVLFQLLKDVEPSIWIARLLSFIQLLQVLYFPFHRELKHAWYYDSIANGIEQFLSYFQLITYLKNSSWTAYITVFYTCVALVILIIIDIFYISYSFTKKNQAFSWPIYSLRTLLSLIVTVLFMPLLDFFLSIISCQSTTLSQGSGITSSVYVHEFFSSVVCWQDVHILHAVVSIFISIAFIIVTFLVVLIYFECLHNSNDPTARVTSRPNFVFLLYQVVLIIAFTFMNNQQNDYVLIGLLIAGSLVTFTKFHYESPFYNEEFQKIWSFITALQVWSAILLCFAKFLENNLFEGTIIAWIIGIPILGLIVINQRKQRIDLLLINVNKFETGEQLISQARYLLQLIRWSKTSKTASILLDGYLEVHKQTCQREDCAAKQKKNVNSRVAKNLINVSQSIENQADRDKINILYQVIYHMFFYGVKKFPNNTNLRLAYAFFLMENSKYKQQALQELSQAETNHPSFDIDFIIFRYKKLIEDEIAESQQDGNMDIVSEMAFQNNLRSMQNNIERCALQHMDFWSQLGEDSPDLGKLNEIGVRISLAIQQVEEQWNRLKKMSNNIPKAMRLFGKYNLEVLNDKENGEALLERARAIHNSNANNRKVQVFTSNDEIQNESYPTIIITTEQDKFGQVVNMNQAASNLFSYQKSEVINRKINLLMPNIHSKYHDQFLENYLNSTEVKFMNRERYVIGKSKSNYVFPCFLSLRTLSSLAQGFQFLGSFRIEKVHRKICYIYTDIDGNIEHISSQCISFLKIDNKFITSKKTNIDEIAPKLFDDKETYMQKSGASYIFKPLKKEDDPTGNGIEMNVLVQEIQFFCQPHAGYFIKFEVMTQQQQQQLPQTSNLAVQSKLKNRIGLSCFQFTFVPSKSTVVGQYVDQMNSEIHSQRVDDSLLNGQDANQTVEKINLTTQNAQQDLPQDSKVVQPEQQNSSLKNYGLGIKRMRLYYDHIAEVEDDKSDSEEEEENEMNKSIFQNKNDEDEGDDANINEFNSNFKSRKAVKAVVNDESEPSCISNLKRVTNVLVLILILIAFLDYFLSNSQFDDIKKNVNLIIYSNRMLAEMQGLLSYVRDLKFMEMGLYDDLPSKATTRQQWIAGINQEIVNIQYYRQNITFSDLSITSDHSYLLYNQEVNLISSAGQNIQKPFLTSIEIMYTYAQNIAQATGPIKQQCVYFETNMFSQFYLYMIDNANMYVNELFNRTSATSAIFIIWMIIAGISLFVSFVIFIPLSIIVNRSREEVLGLFLDIKEKRIKNLYSKCENFINNLQIGEEEDIGSLDDIDKLNEEDPFENKLKKRKRKFKNSSMNFKQICLGLLSGAIIIEAYFFFNYFITYQLMNSNNQLVQELNATSYSEAFFLFADNSQRQLFYDQKTKIFGTDPSAYTTQTLNQLYQLDSSVHQEHALNINVHNSAYNNAFDNVMMLDPCSIVFSLQGQNQDVCEQFAEKAVSQGMAVAVTRYFENLRYFNSIYQILYKSANGGPTVKFSDVAPSDATLRKVTGDPLTDQLLSLLRTSVADELRQMQIIYNYLLYRYLEDYFQNDFNQHITDANTSRIALFIVFNVLMFVIYFLFWLPLVSKLSRSIWRTRGMLTMIPLEVIKETKSIQKFIRRYLNEHSVSNY
ncbi:PAS domain S-box protein (macronuclear) [Tetrahymena thermophila SB210]|uniref:PAS domain S-box protein n=1 Tax=Tetrahymena thermophila (strain SB210) TaxID=312017 RepID=I7MMY6_TETTS|nr:PAS domain S-box protein [Tetrahymena thermophila SB210]EAS07526.3 PAS domain S-box protein [Tetrahymena thermophila SB210]|eukprot:XP_001027768.3 PAS domain S-box protein [Tetrahymena thermophila SB210]